MIDRQRMFDLALGIPFLLVTLPIQAAAAMAVRLSSPGPAWYRARRVGRGGAEFTLLKFRSMRDGPVGSGPRITASHDSRITAVGVVLRETKIDELPQLINVLKGEMSLVGPRPEDRVYVDRYDDAERRVLLARPGITGPASIAYRHEERLLAEAPDLDEAYERIRVDKLRIDLDYLDRRTIRSDLRILLETASAVFDRNQADGPGSRTG